MIFHAFYNLDHVGDVLLARLKDANTASYEKINDIVVLKDENETIIGYNILHASNYFSNLKNGMVSIDETFMKILNDLLKKEQLEPVKADYKNKFVIGKILEMKEHPDSDHLHICQVDLKDEVVQIVCGAPNVEKGQLVVVAKVGAVMPNGLVIRPSKLRKVESNGMICSARELMLPNAPQVPGILILNENEYHIGEPFLI